MDIYFHRYFITTSKHVVMAGVIKYQGKYLTICLILEREKEAIYMWQNSILVFYINTFLEKVCIFDSSTAQPDTPLNGFFILIAVAHESDW